MDAEVAASREKLKRRRKKLSSRQSGVRSFNEGCHSLLDVMAVLLKGSTSPFELMPTAGCCDASWLLVLELHAGRSECSRAGPFFQ